MARFDGNRAGRPTAPLGLAVVSTAQFVVVLDATIVTTALPAMRSALGFDEVDLPWVITAYVLAFGALLVPGGRVADLAGPRRAFRFGLAVFTAASVTCALAWSPAVLVVARALQGLGAATLAPAALALLTTLSEPGAARRRAVGWWTAAAACGGASGWVLGGLLTEFLGWRAVFWVNLPIGLTLVLAAARVLPMGTRRQGARLDVGGAIAVTVALGLLVYGLTSTGEQGLRPAASWVPLLVGAVVSAVFVRHVLRAGDPLVPPTLFRAPATAGANLTALMLTATTTPVMYLTTLYVQQVMRFSPTQASLLFPVFNVAVVGGSLAGPELVRRHGARHTLVAGFVAIGAGAACFALLPGGGTPIAHVVCGFAVMGAGLGAASVASTHAGTEAADPAHQGVAAGVLNSAAQIGSAIGLAILAPLAASASPAAMAGYRAGFAGAGALALAGLLASLLVPASCRSVSTAGAGVTLARRPPSRRARTSRPAGRWR